MMKNNPPTVFGIGLVIMTWSAASWSQEAEAPAADPPPEASPPEPVAAEEEEADVTPDTDLQPETPQELPVAQDTPPAGPEPEPEPEVEEPVDEPAEPAAEEVEEVEEAAEGEGDFEPSFSIGIGVRSGLQIGLSGPGEGEISLNDGLVDQIQIRPYMSGSLTEHVGFFAQFEVGTPSGLGNFAILDAIAQIRFLDELQLWVGQHIPANDRNNMNGPFFGNTWNFAIAVEEYPFDVGARDRGATLWGLIAGGRLKYHLSMVDLQPGREIGDSRFAGRVDVHFWEPEAFYYNSGTYWGTQDILTIGAVIQGQSGVGERLDADGMLVEVDDDNLLGFSVDAMMEKNFGKGGTLTLEASYWNYEGTGENYLVNQGTVDAGRGVAGPYPGSAFMGVASWLTPGKLGPGQLQPNFRVQYADWDVESRLVIDGGLAYVLDGFNHKYHINYRHFETDPADGDKITGDSIQLGFQYLMGL